MITFKEYLLESCMGNYVSVDVSKPMIIKGLAEKFPTSKICIDEQHATLMYSETTEVLEKKIQEFLKEYAGGFEANLKSVAAFDSPDTVETCAIVVKIECDTLNKLHEGLKALGMKHSYPDFQPHISVMYKTPKEDKDAALAFVRAGIKKDQTITLKGFNVDPIDKEWASKLK
jgi:2'-5' RNA ligase